MAVNIDQKKGMEAIVISYKNGFTIYHSVKLIRLLGRNLNLLIMADYMPTLGEINGRVEILYEETLESVEEKCISFENITGFFVIKNNIFKLLLKEDSNAS